MNDIEWRGRGVEWRAWSGTEHAHSSGTDDVEGVEGEGGVEGEDQDVEGVDQDDVEGVGRRVWHGPRRGGRGPQHPPHTFVDVW